VYKRQRGLGDVYKRQILMHVLQFVLRLLKEARLTFKQVLALLPILIQHLRIKSV
jgi:hypothetical protein